MFRDIAARADELSAATRRSGTAAGLMITKICSVLLCWEESEGRTNVVVTTMMFSPGGGGERGFCLFVCGRTEVRMGAI